MSAIRNIRRAALAAAILSFATPLCPAATTAPAARDFDRITRGCLLALWLDDPAELERQLRTAHQLERNRREQGQPASGLLDNLEWLAAIRRAAGKGIGKADVRAALAQRPDPLCRFQIEATLRQDPQRRFHDLKYWQNYDTATAPLNSFFQATSGVLLGSIEAVFHFGVDVVFWAVNLNSVTEYEKQRYALTRRWRNIASLPPAERSFLREQYAALEQRMRAQYARELLALTRYFAKDGDYVRARELARRTVLTAPDCAKAQAAELRLRQVNERRSQIQHESNLVLDSGAEPANTAHAHLLHALIIGDPASLEHQLELDSRDPRPALSAADRARIRSVADDLRSRRDLALLELEILATRFAHTVAGKKAAALSASADYNLQRAFLDQLAAVKGAAGQYVFFGRASKRDQLYIVSHTSVTPTASNFAGLGIYSLITAGVRVFRVFSDNPVPQDQLLAAGENLLGASNLKLTPERRAEVLAELAARAQSPDDAAHIEKFLAPAEYFPRQRKDALADKQAHKLYVRARQAAPADARALYQHVIAQFPGSAAAEKSRKQLYELDKRIPPFEITLSRKEFLAQSKLWRETGLNLAAEWLDGNPANGELRDPALEIAAAENRRVWLRLGAGHDIELHSAELVRRLRAFVVYERNRAGTIEDYRQVLLEESYPFEVRGSLGASGVRLYPHIGRVGDLPE